MKNIQKTLPYFRCLATFPFANKGSYLVCKKFYRENSQLKKENRELKEKLKKKSDEIPENPYEEVKTNTNYQKKL